MLLLLAALVTFGSIELAPVAAQTVVVPSGRPRIVPPDAVLAMLRSNGFSPLERPVRRGVTYALRAVDADGEQVRVIVDARAGAILAVTPIVRRNLAPGPGMATAPRPESTLPNLNPGPPIAPGPNLRRSPQVSEPDGYIAPQPGARAVPPVVYESNPPVIYGPRPPAAVPGAPVAGVPRDDDTSSPRPQIVAPEPGTGVLPPPPERFPQRVAPAPEPKAKPSPRRTVSAAPPKPPPLPRPRPEARAAPPQTTAPAASSPMVAPPPPAPSSDDVPH